MKAKTVFLKPFTGTKGRKVRSKFGVSNRGRSFGRVGKYAPAKRKY